MKKDNKKNNRHSAQSDKPISAIVFSGKVKFRKLAKSTFIFTSAPALIISIFIVNGYIAMHMGLVLFAAMFVVALMFTYPYIADLQEVTNYVEELAEDRNPIQPELSFLQNVEELSESIEKLNSSWLRRNEELKTLLLEDEILINSLPNIVLMLDNKMQFLQSNQAAKKIFGWNYRESITNILADERLQKICSDVMESGQGANIKFDFTDIYYYYFDIRIEKFPINSPNGIALILIMQNLTQQKKTEKMLSDFVANASHEMKTPLASISGFIEVLSTQDVAEKDKREFLNIMQEQSARMSRLIEDLLVLSMAESGSEHDKYSHISLGEVVQESVFNLSNFAKASNIKITLGMENSLPRVFCSRDDISRVVDNLISNAIKYGKEGSEVLISLSTIFNKNKKLTMFSGGQQLICVSVKDSGIGIEDADIPRITERFFRVNKSRSRNIGGAGLGLAIVKQIIENHNGYLDIKSKVGEGSTFSVYLPIEVS